MTEREHGAPRTDADRVERLRRDLYRPGAGETELRAYAASRGRGRPAAPAPPTGRRVSRRALLVGAATALPFGTTALLLLRSPAAEPVAAPTVLPLGESERGELRRNLARGEEAGIRSFLLTRPYPRDLPRLGRKEVLETAGRGSAAVPLDAQAAEAAAGRLTVLVVLESAGTVEWTAARTGLPHPVAVRRAVQAAGSLTSAGFPYATGGRPDLLRITVPGGMTWGLAAVFSTP